MAVTMPKVDVTFRQYAKTLMTRSERGIAILLFRDEAENAPDYARYTLLTELQEDEALYSADTYNAIADVLAFTPYETLVFKVGTTLTAALAEVYKKRTTGWITIANMTTEDTTALVDWIKTQKRSYKAVVYNATAPDDMHIVNFVNTSVTFTDDRGTQGGVAYLPSLLGIFATCNVQRGCTNYLCSNLSDVTEAADNDAAVGSGQFILCHDEVGDVRIALGINSLTTYDGETQTEDMSYIETVEAMDLMRDDISATFRQTYLGVYRNSLDNQMLFLSALNYSYFSSLAEENILDPEYDNIAEIDVDTQRKAWVAIGTSEAADWDDDEVRSHTFKRDVYLRANVKILNSMTNLIFVITIS